MRTGECEAGFVYLGLLMFAALMGAALATAGVLWHTAAMREKEKQLLFVGHAYRRAIEAYYVNTPGPVKRYPRELDDLLRDPRVPFVRRYLRKLYRDPITNTNDWGLVKAPDGGIAGVYSQSNEAPFKTANFRKADAAFSGKTKYSDWKFVAISPASYLSVR